ncbi:MAG: translocation/assembly module TamB domain-containing protein [Pseudomonadota bacterium]
MKRLAAIAIVILSVCMAGGASAQQDDRGFLTGLIEDALSDAGREVRIEGFEGALSSEATLARMTIADEQGIWLKLEGARLNWARSALLRGRLDVTALTADKLVISRAPDSGEAAIPNPEASGFALPDLPVFIEIDQLRVAEITLGAPLLGEEVRLSLDATLSLSEGSGEITLQANRLDSQTGRFDIAASYANQTQSLDLNIDLQEAADGIAARLLGLPDRPALALRIAGSGELDDFTSDIALSSDGINRLSGQVTLRADQGAGVQISPPRRFDVDIEGDVTALFAPQYRPFFGEKLSLTARGQRDALGAIALDRFQLSARTINLAGSVKLNAKAWPVLLDVDGQVFEPDGGGVLLPVTGGQTRLNSASFSLNFDQDLGDAWRLDLRVSDFTNETARIGALNLSAVGTLDGKIGRAGTLAGDLDLAVEELKLQDPDVAQALGSELAGELVFGFAAGGPLRLSRVDLVGAGFAVTGSAEVDTVTTGMHSEFDLNFETDDVSRFKGFAGRDLSGAASVAITGSAAPLAGTFDVDVVGRTRDLTLSQPQADAVLRGVTQLEADIVRSEAGTVLRSLELENEALSLAARARLATDDSTASADLTLKDARILSDVLEGSLDLTGIAEQDATGWRGEVQASGPFGSSAQINGQLTGPDARVDFDARLPDISVFIPQIQGPFATNGELNKAGPDWQVDAQATAPGNTRLTVLGQISTDGRLRLDVDGSSLLGLLDPVLKPRSLAGRAEFDLTVDGPPALGSVSGTIVASQARFAAPDLGFALTDIGARIGLGAAQATVDVQSTLSTGGRISLNGPVGMTGGYNADLALAIENATLTNPELYRTQANGQVAIRGPLAGGAIISGRVDFGETEIRVPSSSVSAAGDLPVISHENASAEIRKTLERAGQLDRAQSSPNGSGPRYGLDLELSAPSRIFVRGRGLDAELGGSLAVGGTTQSVSSIGQFNLIRGRLDILSQRFQLDEGLVQLQGTLEPFLRFVARTQTETGSASIVIEGNATDPRVTFESVPDLPQEEVLAQIFFGRDASRISAFQALQLANAVATLAGRGGISVISNLRQSFGLDDLDVSSDEQGNTAVRAGRYLSENVYTDVTVGGQSGGAVSLNIDLSPSVTARGNLESDGNSSLGVFFERDY